MKLVMPGNNFNQRGWVHLPSDICRTIIGGGGHGGYHAGNEPKVIVKVKRMEVRTYGGKNVGAADPREWKAAPEPRNLRHPGGVSDFESDTP